MKKKLFTIVLSVTLFSLHFGDAQNTPGIKWVVKKPFEQKAFIENKGQYEIAGKATAKDILFYARQGGLQYYFTPTGILISRIVSVKRSEKEIEQLKQEEGGKKPEEDDDNEFKRIEQFHEMNFDDANSHDAITGTNEVSWHYSYTLKGNLEVTAHAWKKLTYHNLYPGIDMEFYFPEDKEGFEYSFIVHPGADASQIKIKYNGATTLNPDGKITIASPYGNFTGYAPVAKLMSSDREIKCDFSLSNGRVKFTSGIYDKSEALLIDPLIITPNFNRTNDAYDLDWDDAGNIYVYGGSYPWQILKYNSAGTFLWSYTTIFDGNNQYIGDFAVDRHSQSVYVTEGRNDQNNTGAIVIKLNSAGGFVTQYNGNMDFNEMWKIAFSSCTDQAVIAGGGSTDPSYTASYLDTNLTNLSLVNALNADIGFHDMWGLALDNFGNSYMVTAQSLFGPLSQTDSFDNVILKLPLPALVPTTWMVPSNYDVLEHSSLTYGLNGAFQPGNGYNGMTVSDTTLYTYDSYVLKQWGTKNGNILDSIFVNGPSEDNQISWGGLTSDDCGNIFLGSVNTVEQYNSDLNLIQTFAEPDTVYDVRLSNTDMLYACGIDFISATQVSLPSCHIIKVTNNVKNVDCDTLGSATVTPTGGTPPYTITWNTVPVQTGNTATGLYAGTYIAKIYDSSCIVQTLLDTMQILTNAIQISPNNATICQGNSAELSASGAVSTYSWSPSTGLSSTSGSSVVASPTITTTYTVIGTSTAGCTDTVQSVVTVNPAPIIVVTTPSPICFGTSTTLTVSGAMTYSWSPSTGLSGSTGSSLTANPITTTIYTVTGTDSIGCTSITTVTVTVNPNPTIIVATPAPICSGTSTTLTANGAVNYIWTPNTGLSATTGSSITANPTTTTIYTVTGTDVNGCTVTTTVTVTVNLNPIIIVATPAPICSGTSTTLIATGAAFYSWAPSTGLSATSGSLVTANPTTTSSYTVIGTDVNGCTNTTTVVVTVNPNLIVTVLAPAPICLGSSATLIANGAATYTWSPSTGLSNTTGSSVIVTPTVTSTYTLAGTSGVGCSSATTVTVIVNPNPTIIVATPPPICSGTSTTLTTNGAANYTWIPATGLSATAGSSVTANPTTATTYTVTGTDVNGCIGTTTVTVTVNPNPIIIVATPAPICSGTSTTLTANGAVSYSWAPSTGLSATSGSLVTANPTTTSTYTVIGTDVNGCTNTTTVVVTVNPNLIVTVLAPAPICVGSSATLTANGAATYIWSPLTGLSNTTGSSVIATPTITSTYTITGTSGVGCSSAKTVTVTVNPNPTITVATPAPICNGTSTMLIANGAVTYIWTPATGLSATTGSSITANPTTTIIYTVTGTDVNGCTATTTGTVAVNPNPTIIVATPVPICSGASTTLTANGGVSYSWTPSTGLSATSGSSVTANPTTTTTYTVTGIDGGGCTGTTTVIATVNPNPTVTVATPTPICIGNSITLTANGASTYLWIPSVGLNNSTGSSVIVNPTTTSTYNITGTDGNGCTATTGVIVTVNPSPAITVTAPKSICSGNSATMTVTGATTYIWTPTFGLNDTTGSSVIATPVITSTYTITGTNAVGCTNITAVTITVNPNPTIIVSTPSPMCVGSTTTLTANGAKTYSWSPAISLSATSGSSVTANPTTTLTYTVTGVDVNGCMAAAIVPVTVNPNPIIEVTTPSPICNGSSITLTASGASTYIWTPSIGLNNSTGSSVTAYSTITTTYNVTGTDSNTCTATKKVIVTVNPNPIITAISPPPMCSGNSTLLTAKGAITYLWAPSTGLSNSMGSSVSANPTITTTYTIMGTDGNGCSSSAKINVNIYPLPQITVNFPPAFCKGDSATLVAQGAISYSWSPSTGLSAISGSSVLSKPGNSVTYTVTGISSNGCSGTSEVSVLVNPNPTVSAPTPPGICNGNSQTLRASGAVNYSWSPSEGLNMTSGSSVIANPTTSTTYTVIGTNEAGCPGKAQVQLLVMPLPSVSVFGLSPSYCTNSSPVMLIGNPKGGTFSGNGVDSNQFNPALTGVGSYLIKYIYVDSNGCEDSSISQITVDPLPKVIVNPNNPTVCSGIPVTLNAMGADNYTWRPGTGLSDSTASNVTADPTVTTTYVVTGINSDSCFDTAMVTVYVDSTPTASFNTQTSNYCEPLTMQFNNVSNEGSSYSWDFGDGTTSSEFNPQHTYKQGGTYQVILTVTSRYGCVNDIVKEVVIKQSFDDLVQIGNAFTPDDYGINSIITPRVLCTDLSGYVFRVYNRWGQLLFQTYDPNIGWDGRFNAQMQLVGVYDYYIEFNCGDCKIFKKGNITLLK